ncbi:MAG: cytochrome c [Gammaproteobacteria bacterium]|nr:cytochrome c [Gammaproteobacteria bacterium]
MIKKRQGVVAMFLVGLLLSGVTYAADSANGGQIYSRHCTTCHGNDGRGTMPSVPDFTRGQGLFKPNRDLLDIIEQGKEIMPAFQGILTRDEMDDVVAYLRTFL